ncbi:MAG: glutathione S-transferase family protein [Halomonadaceae bacterium]
MLTFYYHPTPNPRKVALFLEEAGLPFTLVPVDTAKGEQHDAAYRAVNPNDKVPAIDDDGTVVFDSNAILLYLGEKTGQYLGDPTDRGDLLSWLMFIATGLGPFSGQSVHFHRVAPESIPYAQNRYRKETERHYAVLDKHLQGRDFIVGNTYTIVDMAAWAWVDRAALTLGGERLGEYPEVERWFQAVDARPAVARARQMGQDIEFKSPGDEDSRRALYPSNYPD